MRVSMLALALILFSPAVFSWAQTVNGPEGEKMTPQSLLHFSRMTSLRFKRREALSHRSQAGTASIA